MAVRLSNRAFGGGRLFGRRAVVLLAAAATGWTANGCDGEGEETGGVWVEVRVEESGEVLRILEREVEAVVPGFYWTNGFLKSSILFLKWFFRQNR